MDQISLRIASRAARVEDALHPFQRQLRQALQDPANRIIRVEAPVGAGKSKVIRDLLEQPSESGQILVLTYPTKILKDAQVGALRADMKLAGRDLCVWPQPDAKFRPGAINLINYSTDSLLQLLRSQGPEALRGKRGDLLHKLFDQQEWYGHERAVVTTPDVLHLIVERKYGSSKRLQRYLNAGGLFVFDEFHLCHNLGHFVPLLEEILNQWNGRILLLSATPLASGELQQLFAAKQTVVIDFAPASVGDCTNPAHRTFNYPLDLRIESFRTSDLEEWLPRLATYLSHLVHPTAVILDSVHRLQWLRRRLQPIAQSMGLRIQEWSGLQKDREPLTDRSVLLGCA